MAPPNGSNIARLYLLLSSHWSTPHETLSMIEASIWSDKKLESCYKWRFRVLGRVTLRYVKDPSSLRRGCRLEPNPPNTGQFAVPAVNSQTWLMQYMARASIRRATPLFQCHRTQHQITKAAESNLVTINRVQIKFYGKCCKYLIFAHMDTIVWLERWPLEK